MRKLKRRVFEIIQAADGDDIASKVFDLFIIVLIVINVALVLLDTFNIPSSWKKIFHIVEVVSVVIFTFEYLLRLWTANYLYEDMKPAKARIKYALSFMAVVDLLAILPFYLPLLFPVDLRVLRMVRLFRLLRILKANRYTTALSSIVSVLRKKAAQLVSAVSIVMLLMVIASVLMYSLENEAQPEVFNNAFSGLWWAVATFTTVGYGDIYPITVVGKILSSIIAMLGIGLVAVPTGIISSGFIEQIESEKTAPEVEKCFCPYCGNKLER